MFLSHTTIERLIKEGKLVITPEFRSEDIRPAGIRIHLAQEILVPEPGQTVDLTEEQDLKYREVDLTKEEFFLEPGDFVLGATCEAIQTPPNVLAILDGRSTVARVGLTTHVTAAVIDGTLSEPHVAVLEIKNSGNFRIRLKYRDPIAMMIFAEVDSPIARKFATKYGGQGKATPPRFGKK